MFNIQEERRYINRKLKKGLLVLGIVASVLGVVSTSVALYLNMQNPDFLKK